MTQNAKGYQIPSVFNMIQTINVESPKMILVHETEFKRIDKIISEGKTLDRPHKNYLEMVYSKYILEKQIVKTTVAPRIAQHIGMKIFNTCSKNSTPY